MNELQYLQRIADELQKMGVDATVDHPGTVNWQHDDLMLIAGFANGTWDVDVNEQNGEEVDSVPMFEYMTTACSGFEMTDDPRVLAAFFKGVQQSRII